MSDRYGRTYVLVSFEGLPTGLSKRLLEDSQKAIHKNTGRQFGPGQLKTQFRPLFKTTFVKDENGVDTDEVDTVAEFVIYRGVFGGEGLILSEVEEMVAEKTNTNVNSIRGKISIYAFETAQEVHEFIKNNPQWNGVTS